MAHTIFGIMELAFLELVDEALQKAGNKISDEDVFKLLGIVEDKFMFTEAGLPTVFCTEITKKISTSRPHLRTRVQSFIASGGQSAS